MDKDAVLLAHELYDFMFDDARPSDRDRPWFRNYLTEKALEIVQTYGVADARRRLEYHKRCKESMKPKRRFG